MPGGTVAGVESRRECTADGADRNRMDPRDLYRWANAEGAGVARRRHRPATQRATAGQQCVMCTADVPRRADAAGVAVSPGMERRVGGPAQCAFWRGVAIATGAAGRCAL